MQFQFSVSQPSTGGVRASCLDVHGLWEGIHRNGPHRHEIVGLLLHSHIQRESRRRTRRKRQGIRRRRNHHQAHHHHQQQQEDDQEHQEHQEHQRPQPRRRHRQQQDLRLLEGRIMSERRPALNPTPYTALQISLPSSVEEPSFATSWPGTWLAESFSETRRREFAPFAPSEGGSDQPRPCSPRCSLEPIRQGIRFSEVKGCWLTWSLVGAMSDGRKEHLQQENSFQSQTEHRRATAETRTDVHNSKNLSSPWQCRSTGLESGAGATAGTWKQPRTKASQDLFRGVFRAEGHENPSGATHHMQTV